MELFIEDPHFKTKLAEPVHSIRQVNVISYYNARLVHRTCPARYVGATHEYLEAPTPPGRIAGVWFNDRACGSSRVHKFERDIRLLSESLRRDPDNCRSMFYLAQSYKDSGRFEEAIDWYARRVQAGGWQEEVWYSLYMIALCHEELGHGAEMIDYCWKAFHYRPTRVESLWSLARHYRSQGDYNASMSVCETAAPVPYPHSDSLFIQDYVYKTGIAEEMSIAGYYCNSLMHQHNGYQKSIELMSNRDAEETARSLAFSNFYYYAKSAGDLFDHFSTQQLNVPIEDTYVATNPSIWRDSTGTRLIARGVNYRVQDMVYDINDPQGIVRTLNYVVALDDNYHITTSSKILDRAILQERFPSLITGYEDCRLFVCRGYYWATATVCDRNPDRLCEIALLRFDEEMNLAEVNVLRGINPDHHQKNWMPLVRNDELFLIYTVDPTVVLRYDFDSHSVAVVHYGVPDPWLEKLRGGSQAIQVGDHWIFLSHETNDVRPGLRFYQHRFVAIDNQFQIAGVTEPFYFLRKGIEFAAGLAYDSDRHQFIASFGVDDREAHLAFFDEGEVLRRLGMSHG